MRKNEIKFEKFGIIPNQKDKDLLSNEWSKGNLKELNFRTNKKIEVLKYDLEYFDSLKNKNKFDLELNKINDKLKENENIIFHPQIKLSEQYLFDSEIFIKLLGKSNSNYVIVFIKGNDSFEKFLTLFKLAKDYNKQIIPLFDLNLISVHLDKCLIHCQKEEILNVSLVSRGLVSAKTNYNLVKKYSSKINFHINEIKSFKIKMKEELIIPTFVNLGIKSFSKYIPKTGRNGEIIEIGLNTFRFRKLLPQEIKENLEKTNLNIYKFEKFKRIENLLKIDLSLNLFNNKSNIEIENLVLKLNLPLASF